MPYVICDPCAGARHAACVDACPADCIHPRCDEPRYDEVPQLYINAAECTDCGACAEECPAAAIYPRAEVPERWSAAIGRNARWYGRGCT
jgi:ferredoxin